MLHHKNQINHVFHKSDASKGAGSLVVTSTLYPCYIRQNANDVLEA